MRLVVAVRSAIASILSPLNPCFANSFVATERMSRFVLSGSYLRDRAARLAVGCDLDLAATGVSIFTCAYALNNRQACVPVNFGRQIHGRRPWFASEGTRL